MATWTLLIDNRLNVSTIVYLMEIDTTGTVTTPENMWSLVVGEDEPWETNLAKRLYNSIIFGGSKEFPPICKAFAAGQAGDTLVVSENTTALQMWTYANGVWTVQPNITEGIRDDALIRIPALKVAGK